jgi:hypothetical protein
MPKCHTRFSSEKKTVLKHDLQLPERRAILGCRASFRQIETTVDSLGPAGDASL